MDLHVLIVHRSILSLSYKLQTHAPPVMELSAENREVAPQSQLNKTILNDSAVGNVSCCTPRSIVLVGAHRSWRCPLRHLYRHIVLGKMKLSQTNSASSRSVAVRVHNRSRPISSNSESGKPSLKPGRFFSENTILRFMFALHFEFMSDELGSVSGV